MLRHEFDDHGLAQRLALIRFHFHAVPGSWDEFIELWTQLEFALQFSDKLRTIEIKKG
jgi:hypothetical protein